mmetsp:Transcript_15509/g.33745  ORF Transcript_15509/g.33745 Transcript_15509/m.33745 type:complete len:840 (-) Transcript_15509:85-2604(-)
MRHKRRRRRCRAGVVPPVSAVALSFGSAILCFGAQGSLIPLSAFVSSHPRPNSSVHRTALGLGVGETLRSPHILPTPTSRSVRGRRLNAFGSVIFGRGGGVGRKKILSPNRRLKDIGIPVDGDECRHRLFATSSSVEEEGRDTEIDDDVTTVQTSAAEEICFNPQSFQRGLERCIPDPSGEDDSDRTHTVYEAALAEVKAREEFGDHDADEICLVVYDTPAMPRYELPLIDTRHKDKEEEDAALHDIDNQAALGMDGDQEADSEGPIAQSYDGTSDSNEYDSDSDDRQDGEAKPLCGRGIVIIDNFSPYHGNYLSRMALEAYGAGVVSALSEYVTGYLFQEKGMTEHLTSRLPDMDSLEDVERWTNGIPFEIVGIICESDSGLDDAERLGEALGLYPDRHDGFSPARRDKFLMNEACQRAGLRVVRQTMCGSVEEALDFARELGVIEKDSEDDIFVDDFREESEIYGQDKAADATEPIANEIHNVENDIEVEDGGNVDDQGKPTIPSNTGVLGLATNDHTSGRGPSAFGCRYCVVKPSRGVASDDVHLCPDLASVRDSYTKIKGSTVFGSMHGEKHASVLVQEFAAGTEYAVDIVSKAGHHKVAAIWRYDKRPANGAAFVYHATELVDADTDVGRKVCEYAMASLDALNVHWGISHNEVIVDEEGPRLVEVNLRQHNTDFAPLTSACIGYNALDMLLAAYLGDADEFPPNTEHKRLVWDSLPDLPVTRAYGAIVHLVSHTEGTLTGINVQALEEIEGMSSVLAMELYPQYTTIGEHIEKTVDIRTDSGWLHIMNDDPNQFKSDYDRIVDLMPHLFAVDENGGDNCVDSEDMIEEASGST